MNFGAIFWIALNALAINKMRSALTMLGIIIGVAAVITMVAVGSGAQERVQEQIKGLGSNIMLVFPGSQTASGVRMGAQTGQNLAEDDAIAIAREVPEVQVAAATHRSAAQMVYGNTNWSTSIFGINNDYLEARDWPLVVGRTFEAAEMARSGKVAIIGQTVMKQLFGDSAQPIDVLDQSVRIRKIPVIIIGVLEKKGQNSFGQDQDDVAMVPISTLRNRISGQSAGRLKRIGSISVKVREGMSMKSAEDNIKELLRARFKVQPGADEPFTVRNLTEVLAAQEASSRVLTYLLAAVASVSLLVGGIGIMNIMLVSVTERTREIGLRMAVGARGSDILKQFLVEATTLAMLGGILGVALGVGAAYLVGSLAGWNTNLELSAIILAVGFSALIGIFFGFYPARKAARLQPIKTLHYK